MFTGIVEAVGEVRSVGPRLAVASRLVEAAAIGDSIAIDGVCLTVVERRGDVVAFDLSRETLDRTGLGELREGDRVNLERPLAADGRFGGHIVQGHVDGVGTLVSLRRDADFHWMRVRFPRELAPYIVHRGSIAIDGISLTVASLGADRFGVQIIPHTRTVTTLADRQPGHRVNLEADIIGKYAARLADLSRGPSPT